MNPVVTVLLNVVLSAFVGGAVAIIADRAKLKDRLRIEHEYEILKQLWMKATNVKTLASVVAYRSRIRGPQDTTLAFQELTTAALQLHQEIEFNKPFYPAIVYRHVSDLKEHIMPRDRGARIISALGQESEETNLYELMRMTSDNFLEREADIEKSVDRLCNLIRRHIHHDYADIG